MKVYTCDEESELDEFVQRFDPRLEVRAVGQGKAGYTYSVYYRGRCRKYSVTPRQVGQYVAHREKVGHNRPALEEKP